MVGNAGGVAAMRAALECRLAEVVALARRHPAAHSGVLVTSNETGGRAGGDCRAGGVGGYSRRR